MILLLLDRLTWLSFLACTMVQMYGFLISKIPIRNVSLEQSVGRLIEHSFSMRIEFVTLLGKSS